MDSPTSAFFSSQSGHHGLMKLLRIHASKLYICSFCLHGFSQVLEAAPSPLQDLWPKVIFAGTLSLMPPSQYSLSHSPALLHFVSYRHTYKTYFVTICIRTGAMKHRGFCILQKLGTFIAGEKTACNLGLESHTFLRNYSFLLLSNQRSYKNKRA